MAKNTQAQEQFRQLMLSRGYIDAGGAFCGVYNFMPFVAFFRGQNAKATSFQLNLRFEQKVKGKFFKSIRSELKGRGITAYRVLMQGNSVSLQFTVPGDSLQNEPYNIILQSIFRAAGEMGITPPTSCAICKNSGVDSFVYENGYYVAVHANCVNQNVSKSLEKAEDNELNGNYLLGIIGAVLGAIVGAIPNVLVIVFAEIISAWLCALIPLAAYFGYKLLKGKMNAVATISTIVASLLTIPVMEFCVEASTFYQFFGEMLPLELYLSVLRESPADFLPIFGQMLLFVGLGVVIVLGIIRKGNKNVKAPAAVAATTMRHINPNANTNQSINQ